jgi:hypothetical protein
LDFLVSIAVIAQKRQGGDRQTAAAVITGPGQPMCDGNGAADFAIPLDEMITLVAGDIVL